MRTQSKAVQKNFQAAQMLWGNLPEIALEMLEELTEKYSLRISSGDLVLLDGKWYVTHSGLLRIVVAAIALASKYDLRPGFQTLRHLAGRLKLPSTGPEHAKGS